MQLELHYLCPCRNWRRHNQRNLFLKWSFISEKPFGNCQISCLAYWWNCLSIGEANQIEKEASWSDRSRCGASISPKCVYSTHKQLISNLKCQARLNFDLVVGEQYLSSLGALWVLCSVCVFGDCDAARRFFLAVFMCGRSSTCGFSLSSVCL